MRILAIESSGPVCSVAVLSDGKIYEQSRELPRRHGEVILSMIDSLMNKAELQSSELDFIAFSEGPGAFTGIRLAASVVQGLAFGWDKPILPIPTLAAIALAAYQQQPVASIAVSVDARKAEVAYGVFNVEEGCPCEMVPASIIAPEKISLPEGQPCLYVGNGWGMYQDRIDTGVDVGGIVNIQLDASHILQLAVLLRNKGAVLLDAGQALPKYMRKSV